MSGGRGNGVPVVGARASGGATRRPTALRRAAWAALAFALATLLPGVAAACTVCMGGQEEASRKAFVGTTAFLTFFPLLMLFLGVGWFIRRTLAREEEEAATARRAGPPRA